MPIALRVPKGFQTTIKESDSFEPGQVRALWESGKIPKGTLAKAQDRADWVPVDDLLRPVPAAAPRVATYGLVAEAPPSPDHSSTYLQSLAHLRPPRPKATDFEPEDEAISDEELTEERERKPKVPPFSYPRWFLPVSMVLLVICLVGLSFWAGYKVGCAQNQVNEAVAILKGIANNGALADLDLPLMDELKERLKDDPKSGDGALPPRGLPRRGPKASLIADDDDMIPPGPNAPGPNAVPNGVIGLNPPRALDPAVRMVRNPRETIELVDGTERIRLWNFSKTAKHFVRPNTAIPILAVRCEFSVENLDRNQPSTVQFGWNELMKNRADKKAQIRIAAVDEANQPAELFPWETDLLKQGSRKLNPAETFVTPLRSSELLPTARQVAVTVTGPSGKTATFGLDLSSLPQYRGQ